MKKFKSLFWFIVLIVFLLTLYTAIKQITGFQNINPYKTGKEICQQHILYKYSGIIDSTFSDIKGIFCFIVNSEEYSFVYIVNNYNFDSRVHKGDSIVKKKGESQFYIYPKNNPDTVLILKFDCNEWDKLDSINRKSGY